jgi:hypothetical protein
MMHQLDEGRKLLGLLMVQHELDFLLMAGRLFTQFLHLFQQLQMTQVIKGLVEEARILYY